MFETKTTDQEQFTACFRSLEVLNTYASDRAGALANEGWPSGQAFSQKKALLFGNCWAGLRVYTTRWPDCIPRCQVPKPGSPEPKSIQRLQHVLRKISEAISRVLTRECRSLRGHRLA